MLSSIGSIGLIAEKQPVDSQLSPAMPASRCLSRHKGRTFWRPTPHALEILPATRPTSLRIGIGSLTGSTRADHYGPEAAQSRSADRCVPAQIGFDQLARLESAAAKFDRGDVLTTAQAIGL
jgi:hypothetical protein